MTTRLEHPVDVRPDHVPGRAREPLADVLEVLEVLEVLQPRLMGPRLSSVLGRTRACHVLDAKYEPHLRTVVLYQHGDELVRGDLLSSMPDAEEGAVVRPGLRVSVFPDDPDLPALPLVMRGSEVGPRLGNAVSGLQQADRRALELRCRVQLLRYRPGKRATVLLTAPGVRPGYVAKVYHDPQKAAAVADESSPLQDVAAMSRTLRTARVVSHLPELGVVVQQVVSGTPLDGLLGSPRGRSGRARDAVELAAAALADLHAGDIRTGRSRPVDKELRRFVLRAGRIASVSPRLGDALGALAQRLISLDGQIPPGSVGLVHGDCKPSQFLLNGTHVYLLDLDHCGISEQATDVATFLASLRQLAVMEAQVSGVSAASTELATLGAVFRRAYLMSAGAEPSLDVRIRWHEAVALERKALRAFARSPRCPLAGALVREGHRCLDELVNLS